MDAAAINDTRAINDTTLINDTTIMVSRLLKVISLLLDYPTEQLIAGKGELAQVITESRCISPEQRSALLAMLAHIADNDLLDVQEAYGALFNRGRMLSLLMFEHVHGESRDRGQAMVDLMAQYETAGFAIAVKELPDYIPLYLEYLSTCDETTARVGLADIDHLLAILAARLDERESHYAACFHALLQLAGHVPQEAIAAVREQVSAEQHDDSLAALDKVWEEEAVDFMQAEQQNRCASDTANKPQAGQSHNSAVPLHWVDFEQELK